MSYTTTGITVLAASVEGGRLLIRVANAHADKVLQCYVNGILAAAQSAPESVWTCELAPLAATDLVALLAVDPAEAACNFWGAAFDGTLAANRLRVRLPQTIVPYRPSGRWRVYRGEAGDGEAELEAYTAPVYPGGRRACGFGAHLGSAFGYDGAGAAGLGATFGVGEFGFDCDLLTWTSKPLPPGTYPIRVTVLDAAGNESAALETTVSLNTYARPARGLAVDSYVAATDTVVLTFTPSEDIPHD